MIKEATMKRDRERQPDLDRRTVHFTLTAAEELTAGDALIIRHIEPSGNGWKISAVPEKAVKDEAAKLFA